MEQESLLRIVRFIIRSVKSKSILYGLLCFILYHAGALFLIAQNFEATPLTHPDGDFNVAAINNLAQVAGTVVISETVYHAVRLEQDGQFTDLQELGGNVSSAYCMNEFGDVAGYTVDLQGFGHVVVWENGGFRELQIPPDAGFLPIPSDLNNSGVAAGYYTDTSNLTHALVWDTNGVVQQLPENKGIQSAASAINDADEITGLVLLADGTSRAYYWTPNNLLKSNLSAQIADYAAIDIGTLGGLGAQANDINNNGQIVGMANYDPQNQFVHAFVWQDSIMVDLGTLGGDNSRANSINDNGFIVGRSLVSDTMVTKSGHVTRQQDLLSNVIGKIQAGIQMIPLQPLKITSPSSGLKSTSGSEYNAFIAWFSRMMKTWYMMDLNDRINGGMFSDFDDGMGVNDDKGFIAFDHETGYYSTKSDILYIDPEASGGRLGYHWDAYPSYEDAITDNMPFLPGIIYMRPGTYTEDVDIPNGAIHYIGSYNGMGPTLNLNPGNSDAVFNGRFILEDNVSVKMGGGKGDKRIFNNDVEIHGILNLGPEIDPRFNAEVLLGPERNLFIGSRSDATNQVNFGKGSMGMGSIHFKGDGTTQVDLGGDMEAKMEIAKMGMGNLLLNASGFKINDVVLNAGSLEAESDITQGRDATLELKHGFINLRNYSWTTLNPDPGAVKGGSKDAYILGWLFRLLHLAGISHFPLGNEMNYNLFSVQFENDLDSEIEIGARYGTKDEFDLEFSGTEVYFPELGRNVWLNVLAPPAWEIRIDNIIMGDPTVWVTPTSLGNLFGYNSAHLATFDDDANFIRLAGKDPSLVEYEYIDGVVSICHPEVDLNGVRYMAAAFNWFLNPFDLTQDNLTHVGFTNVNPALSEIDLYINNKNIDFSLDFQQGTPYGAILAGNQKVDIVDAKDPDNSHPIASKNIDFGKDIGLNLIITPTVSEDPDIVPLQTRVRATDSDKVDVKIMNVHPNITPVDTRIIVEGESVILGSQIAFKEYSEYVSVKPGLSEIPLLGKLFKYDLKDQKGKSLLIFITPTLVKENKSLSLNSETSFDLLVVDNLGRKIEPLEVTSDGESKQIKKLALLANYPNPFDHITTIGYELTQASVVHLTIRNLNGQTVCTLVDARQQAGYHTVKWDSRDDSGKNMAAGLYLYRLEAGEFVETRTMMLIK